MRKTNLYILTGFLGSGKTTFLKRALNDLEGKKVGVIQNEFGKIGIDGEIIKKDGMELVEINKGSIFCSCLKMNFVEAMCEMADRNLDYLFVEGSGIGDPSNIEDILFGVTHNKGDVYDFAGIICIVDALHFMAQVDDLEGVQRQVKHCNLCIINKTDLVSHEVVSKVKETVKNINPVAHIEEASFAKFNYDFLNEDLRKNKYAECEETTNSAETKPKTLTLTCEESIDKEEFINFINSVSKDTFRMKGFLLFKDGWHQVDVVNSKIDFTPCESKSTPSTMVIISKVGTAIIKTIMDSLNLVSVPMKLKN